MDIAQFQHQIWDHYNKHGRVMPWRQNTNPYAVLVSEIMLQQTQVSRVIPKFQSFMSQFPTVNDLAKASLGEVLQAWSGLGYNRRAKYLHTAAQRIAAYHDGQVPTTLEELAALPGIGPNTAAAILAYSCNQPVVFIETNIRTVYLHHFFPGKNGVTDKELMPFVASTIALENPREWYWALMDYGSYLKNTLPNPSRRSKHHVKQSKFEGSNRQLRGKILKLLFNGPMNQQKLIEQLEDIRTTTILEDLAREELIRIAKDQVELC